MTEETPQTKEKKRLTMGTRIMIGVLAGLATGLFLGTWAAPFQVIGDIYLGLLQMTVLPYIVVSLISKIGSFTYEHAKEVGRHGLKIQTLLWAVSLGFVVILPLSLPAWEAGTFFSASLVEEPEKFDFLDLYIPVNPFASLANNIVPAAVVFSILIGIALIPLANKDHVLKPFNVIGDALGNIANAVIRLTPYGTFALTAGAMGTSAPGELIRLGGYLGTYTLGIILLALVLFPALLCSLTPIRYWKLLGRCRGTLFTAFATGKMFAVLPMIIADVRALLVANGTEEERAEEAANVLVPLAYPFPNAGKVLAIVFIPFAAWFIGQPLKLEDYPLLVSVGLLSFFGSPVVAIPFLLGMFRLPADLVALFIVAGLWGARLGDFLGVMHLTVFSVLTSAGQDGWLRLQKSRALGWVVASVVAVCATLWLNYTTISWSLAGQPPPADRVASMHAFFKDSALSKTEPAETNPSPLQPGETNMDRIRRTGILRVGFPPETPPFSYVNKDGTVVGLEIDLAYRLADELGVELHLIPYEPGTVEKAFANDYFDLAVGGHASVIRDATAYEESAPYLELNAAVVVPDHRAHLFANADAVNTIENPRIGYVEEGVLVQTGRHEVTGLEIVPLASAEDYLEGRVSDLDGLLTTAETGAIYTMMHPGFSVVVPKELRIRVPIILAVASDDDLRRTVDRFVQIKRADGTVESLYGHWILGDDSSASSERWSVLKDVLGWGKSD
ncbi:MAG: cation:dicarboxylase symporter family transporter [Verrucomicrobiota bacterium]